MIYLCELAVSRERYHARLALKGHVCKCKRDAKLAALRSNL